MTIVLNSIQFTKRADSVIGDLTSPTQGLYVDSSSTVNSLSGDDTLLGKVNDTTVDDYNYATGTGPTNAATIGGLSQLAGIILKNDLFLEDGDDRLTGESATKSGRNLLAGIVIGAGRETSFQGNVYMGRGNDYARGSAFSATANTEQVQGILIDFNSVLDTDSDGSATLSKSNQRTGGQDVVSGAASGLASNFMVGIDISKGSILTRAGDDKVEAIANADSSVDPSAAQGPFFVGALVLGYDSPGDSAPGALLMGAGRDTIKATASSTSDYTEYVIGILLGENTSSIIDTDSDGASSLKVDSKNTKGLEDSDAITGMAKGNALGGMWGLLVEDGNSVFTRGGDDMVTGIAEANNLPVDGASAVAGISIAATSLLDTGEGNDKVIAKASVNGGTRSNGFSGGGTVQLGGGKDTLEGFGAILAFGGAGKDTLNLRDYKSTDFSIVKTGVDSATLTAYGATMTISGFESFIFSDRTTNFAGLGV